MSSNLQSTYAVGPGRKMINRVYTVLTRLGLGASYRQLLRVTGRRTGVPRTTPVDVMKLDGTSYLVAPYGAVSWVQNVRAAGFLELIRGGQTCRYLATELDPADAAPVIRHYIASVPVTPAWWSVRADASNAALLAEAATHPVFRLAPEPARTRPTPGPAREKASGGMSSATRVLLDIAFRSVALLVLSETVAAISAAAQPNDDGLGTGLTVMLVLAYAAAGWGLWDGFHRSPVQLCVTWVMSGLAISLGSTLYSHLRFGEWSWSELANDLPNGLVFWAALVFVPAIVCGIVQSASHHSTDGPVA